jgi:hypothetical protein
MCIVSGKRNGVVLYPEAITVAALSDVQSARVGGLVVQKELDKL